MAGGIILLIGVAGMAGALLGYALILAISGARNGR